MQTLRIPTTNCKASRILLALALVGVYCARSPSIARAADPNTGSTSGEKASASTQEKQWVWLEKQKCWGYGYKRADGLWVIDQGTKRKPSAQETDPYGFLGWLNSTRAAFGLSAVGHDPNLTSWAAANNAQQQARGLGHFVMGPARRQNAAMGSSASIGAQWMASPAHRAALLDPSIRWIGIAGMGAYWTFNAN